jgi:hypothetical protein
MFKGIIVLLLITTIILFPIPIKITLKYTNKLLEIYIYNKKLNINVPSTNKLKHKTKSKTNLVSKFIKSINFNDIRQIVYKIINLKFKPSLILKTKLEYGVDDAAFVAILFGMIHSAYSFLYLLLKNFVTVKTIDLKVTPYFEEKDFKIKIKSIIYVSLAKIIYMAIIMSICLINIKLSHKKINVEKYRGGNVHG